MKITPEHYFYVNDGKILKNITDFKKQLKNIDDNTFKYHVNSNKNDFYNWLKSTLKRNDIAEKIKNDKSKEMMIKHLNERKKVVIPVKVKPEKKIEKIIEIEKKRKKRVKSVKLLDEKEVKTQKIVVGYLKEFKETVKHSVIYLINKLKKTFLYLKNNKLDIAIWTAITVLILLILIMAVYVK